MKVVFDTNIYISAFVFVGGSADKAILRILNNENALIISKPIIEETLRIMAEKFERNVEELSRTAVFLSQIATVVAPKEKISVLLDEPDNRILECAYEGNASTIVTGDKAMLKLDIYEGIRIVSLRSYLSNH
jgi:putative PIN family toxin of toxin-antitoxin system